MEDIVHDYNIRQAKYSNAEGTLIDVLLDHLDFGEIPYTYNTETPLQSLDEFVVQALPNLEIAAFEEYVPSQQEQNLSIINSNKTYLSQTDWIVIKIQEAGLSGDTSALLEKYATILSERQIAREEINTLEAENNTLENGE